MCIAERGVLENFLTGETPRAECTGLSDLERTDADQNVADPRPAESEQTGQIKTSLISGQLRANTSRRQSRHNYL